jgi:hypothetical protein
VQGITGPTGPAVLAAGPTGAVQFSDGAGHFVSDSSFTFLSIPATTASGTLHVTLNSIDVSGSGTLFMQQLKINEPLYLIDTSFVGIISNITDNFNLVLDASATLLTIDSSFNTIPYNVLNLDGDFIPTETNKYNLGNITQHWRELFVGPGSINLIGETNISATIRLNNDNIAFFSTGVSVPDMNIGPIVNDIYGTIGGWHIGVTGNPLDSTYDLIAQQNVTTAPYGQTGPIYSLIKQQGPTGPIGPTGTAGTQYPHGRTLYVDQVYGNDTTAAANPYAYSFQTIYGGTGGNTGNSAIGKASANDCIYVLPGTYTEPPITIPTNVSLRGINLGAVTISPANYTANPTNVITMGTGTRLEDVTITASTSANVGINGVVFPNGTAASSAKVRTAVINATSTNTGSNAVNGILCSDTSSNNTVTSVNAIQRATINVSSANATGSAYGVLNSGTSYFSVRDATIFCTPLNGATGASYIGVGNTNTGYTSVKTSSINGYTYDVKRDASASSVVVLNATDLLNSTTDGNGFTNASMTSTMNFGLVAFNNTASGGSNTNYNIIDNSGQYLMPGTILNGSSITSFHPQTPYQVYFPQPCVIYNAVCHAKIVKSGVSIIQDISVNLYKNSSPTAFMTIHLPCPGASSATYNFVARPSVMKSATFGLTDYLIVKLNTGGFNTTDNVYFNLTISLL